VPEWSEFGTRLFCRPSFEVSETHLVRRRLWPGHNLEFAGAIPAQSGFRVGDNGRFTVFPQADGNFRDSLSTDSFYVDVPSRRREKRREISRLRRRLLRGNEEGRKNWPALLPPKAGRRNDNACLRQAGAWGVWGRGRAGEASA